MTEQRVRELVSVWQRRLGLQAWRIHVEVGAVDGEHAAEIDIERDYDEATITVGPDVDLWKDRDGEEIVVHELLHCLERPVRDHVVDLLDQLSDSAATIADLAYRHHRERMIERLAWTLVALGRGDADTSP